MFRNLKLKGYFGNIVIGIFIPLIANGRLGELTRSAIENRIEPVAEVALENEALTVHSEISSTTNKGLMIYEKYCSSCHAPNPKIPIGAPTKGDLTAWKSRMDKGMKSMLENAVKGIRAMPAKGTCMDCTPKDLENAILLMLPKEKK